MRQIFIPSALIAILTFASCSVNDVVLDPVSGSLERIASLHSIGGIVFTKDPNIVITSVTSVSLDTTRTIATSYDLRTFEPVFEYTLDSSLARGVYGVHAMTIANDGNEIALASSTNKPEQITFIDHWDIKTGKHNRPGRTLPPRLISTLAYGPDNSTLIAGANSGLFLWQGNSTERHDLFFSRSSRVDALQISPTGTMAFTSPPATWDLVDKSLIEDYYTTRHWLGPATFYGEGDTALIASGHDLSLFDLTSGERIGLFDHNIQPGVTASYINSQIDIISLSPDESYFVTVSSDENQLRVWDAANGKLIATTPYKFERSSREITEIIFSFTSSMFALLAENGDGYIWKLTK